MNVITKSLLLRVGVTESCRHLYNGSVSHFHTSTNLQGVTKKTKALSVTRLSPEQLTRRKKRLEKELKRLSKSNMRDLRPIEELEITPQLRKDLISRRRSRQVEPISPEQQEQQILFFKEWTRYKWKEVLGECELLHRVEKAQVFALSKLRQESEELYKQAVKLDPALMNHAVAGPLHTPPIAGYMAEDGKWIDHTDYFEDKEKYSQLTGAIIDNVKAKNRK
ncbi:39S ribosomal protein L40, mitochondrial-like isoform X5 [Dreissena polymorpha]|uniref:39S ribosomal protein L40, mitochondrial-like isoform X4 n=1 Tax=Dreissena polymorpha TaxID=45954 RepID=UPI002264A13E|nr:39S ribosomal protein L40, mitochondrial-like isoform X4 [Dreissena polymorpha]XP_052253928.1 39S ribosomal protein L40, mitochondrial-like isoform X5 [Dreissena polymorpha]